MGTRKRVDGYRYVRAYHTRGSLTGQGNYKQRYSSTRWALYEVRNGRACRVGTARSEGEYREWLGLTGDFGARLARP